MGSQQLLIIVVGVIVVGLLIYAGINIGINYYQTSNRDQIISTLHNLGVMAQQYYKKAAEQGGGGGSYSGWVMPTELKNTDAGEIQVVVSNDKVNFVAKGTEPGINKNAAVRVTCRVDQNGIRIIVIN